MYNKEYDKPEINHEPIGCLPRLMVDVFVDQIYIYSQVLQSHSCRYTPKQRYRSLLHRYENKSKDQYHLRRTQKKSKQKKCVQVKQTVTIDIRCGRKSMTQVYRSGTNSQTSNRPDWLLLVFINEKTKNDPYRWRHNSVVHTIYPPNGYSQIRITRSSCASSMAFFSRFVLLYRM